jgi:hypothetical protein
MINTYSTDPLNQPYAGYESVGQYPVEPQTAPAGAVSWAAVFAGAVAAAVLSLILLILGTGLGMTAVSPWSQEGIGAKALGISTIVWLAVMQLLSAGMGGYLAGRLRTRWLDAARDEVFFRDTAHGFLSWAVATLLTAALLSSAVTSILGAGMQAGASLVQGTASSAALAAGGAMAGRQGPSDAGNRGSSQAIDYFVDTLFRESSTPPTSTTGTDATPPASDLPGSTSERSAAQDSAEVARIFMNADLSQPLPPDELRHVAQIVAKRTGLSQQEAEQRVSQNHTRMQTRLQEAEAKARATADEARKATAASALWLFVSLLFGAFVASLAATFGGRQRDT